jgi:threonyl-tRNA synthetase
MGSLPQHHDHREIGQKLDLFHVQEEAAGSVFWHPNGYALFRVIEGYMRDRVTEARYREVRTPQMMSQSIWERSGHWQHFGKNMFVAEGGDDRTFAIKPMNCPGAAMVFNSKTRSYRDLPMRLAEFGVCHRAEPSGALHGIMRVRQFTQDDGHIFCTENQVASETEDFIALAMKTYKDFGFEDVKIGLSTRPASRAGSDEVWDRAEADLEAAVRAAGIENFEVYPGEGAFYGPKLEFALKDSHGREWQCGTLQLDFVLGDRLGSSYTDQDGTQKAPVILHRAVFGSIERFVGILLEHYGPALPYWLAPVQVAVVSAKPSASMCAEAVADMLAASGLRVEVDPSDENLSNKIKKFSAIAVPFIVTIGPRDVENETMAIRRYGEKTATTEPRQRGMHDIIALCEAPR